MDRYEQNEIERKKESHWMKERKIDRQITTQIRIEQCVQIDKDKYV